MNEVTHNLDGVCRKWNIVCRKWSVVFFPLTDRKGKLTGTAIGEFAWLFDSYFQTSEIVLKSGET